MMGQKWFIIVYEEEHVMKSRTLYLSLIVITALSTAFMVHAIDTDGDGMPDSGPSVSSTPPAPTQGTHKENYVAKKQQLRADYDAKKAAARETKKAAKKEYKASKKVAKQEYKANKKADKKEQKRARKAQRGTADVQSSLKGGSK
jgi:hypothetical protein